MRAKQDREQIAELRDRVLAQGLPVPRIVEAIVAGFGVSWLEAQRLARGWTRRKAVEAILATCDAEGWRPSLTPQRLCAWEHDPSVRPGEDYLDRLCRVYQTRADQLGYGHDYTPAGGEAGAEPPAAYAGDEVQADGEETVTNRKQLLGAVGATGLAALLERASSGAVRLGRKLGRPTSARRPLSSWSCGSRASRGLRAGVAERAVRRGLRSAGGGRAAARRRAAAASAEGAAPDRRAAVVAARDSVLRPWPLPCRACPPAHR